MKNSIYKDVGLFPRNEAQRRAKSFLSSFPPPSPLSLLVFFFSSSLFPVWHLFLVVWLNQKFSARGVGDRADASQRSDVVLLAEWSVLRNPQPLVMVSTTLAAVLSQRVVLKGQTKREEFNKRTGQGSNSTVKNILFAQRFVSRAALSLREVLPEINEWF